MTSFGETYVRNYSSYYYCPATALQSLKKKKIYFYNIIAAGRQWCDREGHVSGVWTHSLEAFFFFLYVSLKIIMRRHLTIA